MEVRIKDQNNNDELIVSNETQGGCVVIYRKLADPFNRLLLSDLETKNLVNTLLFMIEESSQDKGGER